MKQLFLVRHCDASGQLPSAPLTPLGQEQALMLADSLAQHAIDLLVSSPYTRAQQSIAPLAQRLTAPVETDARLVECDIAAEPIANWRAALQRLFEEPDLAWPGGESSRYALHRGRRVIDGILERPIRSAVVMTHGRLMTLILRSFDPQFGFQTWAALSNPDVYSIACEAPSVHISRAWPPVSR
jgi:2,3-bisphosphoglycerate-dependent phosphoglycerate mutase